MQHELYIANRIKVRTLFKFDFPGNQFPNKLKDFSEKLKEFSEKLEDFF